MPHATVVGVLLTMMVAGEARSGGADDPQATLKAAWEFRAENKFQEAVEKLTQGGTDLPALWCRSESTSCVGTVESRWGVRIR